MPEIVGLVAILSAVLYWIWRANYAVQTIKTLDRDTKGLQRQARWTGRAVLGTAIERIQDPRLAATILMIQLVRSNSRITAAEKTQIMELMEDPLRVANIERIFVRGWGYTEQNHAFSRIAEDLTPMLRRKLDRDERRQLIGMLTKVAGAYSEPSDLQTESLDRFNRHLMAPDREMPLDPS